MRGTLWIVETYDRWTLAAFRSRAEARRYRTVASRKKWIISETPLRVIKVQISPLPDGHIYKRLEEVC